MRRPQFLPARLLCRVLRAGWGPVPTQPPSRLTRVFYPPKAEYHESWETVQVHGDGTVAFVEWMPDDLS